MGNVENKSFTIRFKIKNINKSWLLSKYYYTGDVYYEIQNRDIHMFHISTNADNVVDLKEQARQHIRKNLKKIRNLI